MLIINSKNIVEKEANKTKYTEYFIEKFLIKNLITPNYIISIIQKLRCRPTTKCINRWSPYH